MELQSKFGLGQNVHTIKLVNELSYSPCLTCGGDGHVIVGGYSVSCPARCSGGKVVGGADPTWQVDFYSHIGRVQITKYLDGLGEDEVCYMLKATGVGSGQLWSDDQLFASKEDAQVECDRRNAARLEKVKQLPFPPGSKVVVATGDTRFFSDYVSNGDTAVVVGVVLPEEYADLGMWGGTPSPYLVMVDRTKKPVWLEEKYLKAADPVYETWSKR